MSNIIQYDSNFLVTDSTLKNVVWVTYGTTTYAQVLAYVNAGQVPCVERNGRKYILSSTDTNYGVHTFSAEGYTIKLWNSLDNQTNVWVDANQELVKCSDTKISILSVNDYVYRADHGWVCDTVPPFIDLIVNQGKNVILYLNASSSGKAYYYLRYYTYNNESMPSYTFGFEYNYLDDNGYANVSKFEFTIPASNPTPSSVIVNEATVPITMPYKTVSCPNGYVIKIKIPRYTNAGSFSFMVNYGGRWAVPSIFLVSMQWDGATYSGDGVTYSIIGSKNHTNTDYIPTFNHGKDSDGNAWIFLTPHSETSGPAHIASFLINSIEPDMIEISVGSSITEVTGDNLRNSAFEYANAMIHSTGSSVGDSQTPVYVTANGELLPCGIIKQAYFHKWKEVYDNTGSGEKCDLNNELYTDSLGMSIVLVYNNSSTYSTYSAPESGWFLVETQYHPGGNGKYCTQLARGYTGNIWYRGKSNGTWSAWKKLNS